MFKTKRTVVILLLYIILTSLTLTGCDADSPSAASIGYLSADYYGVSEMDCWFLACGTGGRLDRIYADGTIENIAISGVGADLTKVLVAQGTALVSGYSGTILYSRNGKDFYSCGKVAGGNILDMTCFKGTFYACTDRGAVLTSPDGAEWKTGVNLAKSAILSIVSNDEYIMAITANTDIYVSKDGENWSPKNFNVTYDGYYEKYVFTRMVNLGISFFILGYPESSPEEPRIIFSDGGGDVWMFKTLTEINDEDPTEHYPLRINSICFFGGELMGACNDGRVVTITNCSVCNYINDVSVSDLRDFALNGDDSLLVVGDNFEFTVLDTGSFVL